MSAARHRKSKPLLWLVRHGNARLNVTSNEQMVKLAMTLQPKLALSYLLAFITYEGYKESRFLGTLAQGFAQHINVFFTVARCIMWGCNSLLHIIDFRNDFEAAKRAMQLSSYIFRLSRQQTQLEL